MANIISGPVWRIDTDPFVYRGPVRISNLTWTNQAAAGDRLVIQTLAFNPIVDSTAYAPNFAQNFGFLGWYPLGIQVITRASGVILISVGAGRA
jgi:hypothetical protein